MSDNKRTGRGVFGKGYYIALILCAAAIGITGYLYYRNADQEDTRISATVPADTVIAPTQSFVEPDVPVIATQPAEQTPPEVTTPPASGSSLKTTAPVSGETVFGYSMEALSYNQTTRDWRVHNGVDIAAEAGTKVVAAADGEVTHIYQDDRMGTTVVIRHTGGYTTQYASLHEDLSVGVGDTVTMGQTIGTVGETALVETAIGPHVHFSVLCQDKQMDPAEFLKLG